MATRREPRRTRATNLLAQAPRLRDGRAWRTSCWAFGVIDDAATSRHDVRLLADTHELMGAILADVERARFRVWVEVYIVRADTLGTRLAEALVRAARRGVDVRLVADALGSQHTPRAYFTALRHGGVQARVERNLLRSLRARRVFPRDHGRIVVADDVAYTGGFAFGDEWLAVAEGGAGWHDLGVRVSGPCVDDFARVFRARWGEAGDLQRRPSEGETSDRYDDLELVADVPSDENAVLQRHLDRIAAARHRVWIEHAYFFPPTPLLMGLADAAARGVDVRVLTPARSDVRSVQWAARGEYERWLGLGIQVFEYGPPMLHGKATLIDDDWGSVGSFNVNLVTLRFASEINLFVRERRFVEALARQLDHDAAVATAIDAGWIRRQPAHHRAWWALTRMAFRAYERLSPLRLSLPPRPERKAFAARSREARHATRRLGSAGARG